MTNNVIEKVLGDNAFYTSDYIKETIKLSKSFIVKNDTEARRYNDYIKLKYPSYDIEPNRRDWRYYRHLFGMRHAADKVVTLTSIDNGDTFELTKASVLIHRRSRKELLEFGAYYDELVSAYPEEELYIKAVITDAMYDNVDAIVDLPEYMFVSYNKALIEDNEHDVAFEIQTRVMNYKHIWLIPYYSLSSDLFLASQYHILYNFIFTSALGVRMENAKTSRAHSYHIRSYLASHHHLDEHLLFLTRKQQLFLYRNMLYLNNHCGVNTTFRTLIDVLFTERNISVVNYKQHQKNSISDEGDTEYTYSQVLLNNKNLGYSKTDKGFEIIKQKEHDLAPGNAAVYDREADRIDQRNRLALTGSILTKDLETILIDETDTVKHKLLDVLTDYWAYMVKTSQMSFLVDYVDPVSNVVKRLNTRDLFKVYVICLFKSQGLDITEFPEYRIKRVFRPTLPTNEQLLSFFYDRRIDYTAYLNEIRSAVPAYRYLSTSYEFSEFVSKLYHLNIGLWSLTSNYSDMHTYAQMSYAIETMHQTELFTYNDETVNEFIERVGIKDVRSYTPTQVSAIIFNLLDNLFDQKLTYQKRLRLLQKSLGEVFFKFNSYTVQLINNYYSDNSIVAGVKDTRYHHKYKITINGVDSYSRLLGLNDYTHNFIVEVVPKLKSQMQVWYRTEVSSHYKLKSEPVLDLVTGLDIDARYDAQVYLDLNKTLIVETDQLVTSDVSADLTLNSAFDVSGIKLSSHVDFTSPLIITTASRYRSVIAEEIGEGVVFTDEAPPTYAVQPADEHTEFLAMNL